MYEINNMTLPFILFFNDRRCSNSFFKIEFFMITYPDLEGIWARGEFLKVRKKIIVLARWNQVRLLNRSLPGFVVVKVCHYL